MDNTLKRLDKVIPNSSWLNLFPLAKLQNHIFTSSDHCQVSLKLNSSNSSKAPPFRFEKMWSLRKILTHLLKKLGVINFNGQ